jgi:hypothetical protein
MGLTRFHGPVYGAKSLLWAVGPATGSTNASTSRPFVNAASITLPNYEDWFITEWSVSCSTCSSAGNAFILKSKGGSTTGVQPPKWSAGGGANDVSTITQTLSNVNAGTSTTLSTWATMTPSPAGEYEGAWVPAGSTLYVVSSGVNPPGQLSWQVRGYIRFRNSTRSEG